MSIVCWLFWCPIFLFFVLTSIFASSFNRKIFQLLDSKTDIKVGFVNGGGGLLLSTLIWFFISVLPSQLRTPNPPGQNRLFPFTLTNRVIFQEGFDCGCVVIALAQLSKMTVLISRVKCCFKRTRIIEREVGIIALKYISFDCWGLQ